MSRKSNRVGHCIEKFRGRALPAHYLGYFDCFNSQRFYEAHDVLEDMWLPDRHGPDGAFYKGLIQLAGAFVHVQKDRHDSAVALLRLARANLEKYPVVHRELDVRAALRLIDDWQLRLQRMTTTRDMFEKVEPPCLSLLGDGQ